MKFLLLGFNNGNRFFNEALQSFRDLSHPNVDRVFEQAQGSAFNLIEPEAVGITQYPSLVFMANTGRKPNGEACYKKVAMLSGQWISREIILQKLRSLSYLPPQVDFDCGAGNVPGAEGEGDLRLDGLLSLPPWLLGIATAVAAYKTLSAKTTLGRAGFGGATLVLGAKYLRAKANHEAAPLPVGRTLFLPAPKLTLS